MGGFLTWCVVYGVPLAPHPDDTAIALLALSDRTQDPVVQSSVQWLERTAPSVTAPWSLAWAVLAFAAHRRPVVALLTTLLALTDVSKIEDNSTLALVCLALDYRRASGFKGSILQSAPSATGLKPTDFGLESSGASQTAMSAKRGWGLVWLIAVPNLFLLRLECT